MAQWRLLKNSIIKRCELMWNFLNEIPEWLARNVSAWIGREAQADAMYRGSSPSRNTHQADRSAHAMHPLFICLIGIGTLQPTIVVFAAERCPATNATKVVSVQGKVTWSVISNATLNAAKLNDLLCVGDTVRVGGKSRAVLRLPNETTIPLDQNTIFQLKEAISEKEPTLIELIQGAIHVITRTPKPFKVNTPYLNAVVEGTEFYVGVDSAEARVAVIEGKVNVSNEQGAVLLIDNEAATAKKGQAPQKTLTIKPRDAVQWALYYPPLFDPRSKTGGQNLSQAHELYGQGKITDAIESLNAVPDTERNGDFYSYRAGLLLLVGRADEAEPDIERALAENGNNTDALSLKAIIAIVKNDKAKALELANQATIVDDKSASARIALSYALQANFKIEDALKAAREATLRDATSALAWARVAELELSIPNYDKSKEAAERAVKLNPNLARTQSILGFANLTRIDIEAAKGSFKRAIELDQADPLPRLGLGLATIREGDLEQGREQIEIAASLDPENSLIRSYLGKAYYEERRDAEAGKQFELAKERDPKDPTPYFYDAIRKQAENRPTQALWDLITSTENNDNRTVYRSKFLLDGDRSTTGIDLANSYLRLGFQQLALLAGSKSISDDPDNYRGHSLLAEAYAGVPRHDVVKLSEALQAQLRQPLGTEVLQPRLTIDNLFVPRDFALYRAAWNEYGSLFDTRALKLKFEGSYGSNNTVNDQLSVGYAGKDVGISFGQLHYKTDGINSLNDSVKRDAYSALLQAKLTGRTTAQLEFRRSSLRLGETFLSINPDVVLPTTLGRDTDLERIAGRYEINSTSDVALAISHEESDQDISVFFLEDPIKKQLKASSGEVQYLKKWRDSYLYLGFGHFEGKDATQFTRQKTTSENGYVYGQTSPFGPKVSLGVGVSFDRVHVEEETAPSLVLITQVNPKFSITVRPDNSTTIRAAYFAAVKHPLVGSQTLEPTQVAGFNQVFSSFDSFFGDAIEGTISKRTCIGFDRKLWHDLYSGLEWTSRRIIVPTATPREDIKWNETVGRAYFYSTWRPTGVTQARNLELATSVEYLYEEINRDLAFTGAEAINKLVTQQWPIQLKAFFSPTFSLGIRQTYWKQSGRFAVGKNEPEYDHNDRGWITDFVVGYKLPNRRGEIEVGVNNVSDKSIRIQETDALNPSRLSKRFIYGNITLSF